MEMGKCWINIAMQRVLLHSMYIIKHIIKTSSYSKYYVYNEVKSVMLR